MSEVFEIPKRTIENWEAGVRKPPAYSVSLNEFRKKIINNNKIPLTRFFYSG